MRLKFFFFKKTVTTQGNHKGLPLHQICNDSGQPQGIAPTSEYFHQY
ncbi:MAG: hypothetical protein KAI83_00070 [Thiomargarita sp.]|nr:hypothetical protein [Thiomargarita sp.]